MFLPIFIVIVILEQQMRDQLKQVAAPVTYVESMLIVTRPDSVTAIIFEDEIDTKEGSTIQMGVKYRFKTLNTKNGRISEGTGAVFKKLKAINPGDDARKKGGFEVGSISELKAGSAVLLWSFRGPGAGWIEYRPESEFVQIAYKNDFETIRLERFKIRQVAAKN